MNPEQQVERAAKQVEAAKRRLAAARKKAEEVMERSKCRGCGKNLYRPGLGRPRAWCDPCRHGEPFKKWFKATYGEKNREYQRLYRRAYRKRLKELHNASN